MYCKPSGVFNQSISNRYNSSVAEYNSRIMGCMNISSFHTGHHAFSTFHQYFKPTRFVLSLQSGIILPSFWLNLSHSWLISLSHISFSSPLLLSTPSVPFSSFLSSCLQECLPLVYLRCLLSRCLSLVPAIGSQLKSVASGSMFPSCNWPTWKGSLREWVLQRFTGVQMMLPDLQYYMHNHFLAPDNVTSCPLASLALR